VVQFSIVMLITYLSELGQVLTAEFLCLTHCFKYLKRITTFFVTTH